jgi:hypothetical protein
VIAGAKFSLTIFIADGVAAVYVTKKLSTDQVKTLAAQKIACRN